MAQRPLALATLPDGGPSNAYIRLFRAVLAEALRDDDAAHWLETRDAELVCLLADVEREAVIRALELGDVPKRRFRARVEPSKAPSRKKARLGKN
jgi:hypothetical protein